VADLGCTIESLKWYLEALFDEHMTWDNWGEYWHIDHIRPLASFDLTDREQFLAAANWSNLQPLEKIANHRKGARYAG
jgi:5-methylcytosine-specific restriction endonuclease McrA